ncbi:MAG: hypothetical protein ACJAW3_000071 [Lentimonas sp.]
MIDKFKKKKTVTTEILQNVVKTTNDRILIKDLLVAMDVGGFGLVMTIFSLPIFVPLPPPLPSLIAIPMMFFSFQMILGYHSPKLPKRITNMSIKRSLLAKMVEKSAPYLRKAESFVKPRLSPLSSPFFSQVIGLFCFVFSASILIPIPFSNFIPGVGVMIASFGLLSKDGVIILIGLLLGCLGVLMTTLTILLGVEAIVLVKDWFLNLFF